VSVTAMMWEHVIRASANCRRQIVTRNRLRPIGPKRRSVTQIMHPTVIWQLQIVPGNSDPWIVHSESKYVTKLLVNIQYTYFY